MVALCFFVAIFPIQLINVDVLRCLFLVGTWSLLRPEEIVALAFWRCSL